MIINLLEETTQILKEHSLSFNGVRFICNAEGIVEVARFVTAADNCTYDNAGKEIFIDPTLCVVGSNWWLSRIRHNGVEKWLFHKKPAKPTIGSPEFKLDTKRLNYKIPEF